MGVATLRSAPVQTCGSETGWDGEKCSQQCRKPSSRNCAGGRDVQTEFVMLVAKGGCAVGGTLSTAVLQVGHLPFSKGFSTSWWLFWDLVKPRPSKEPAPASGAPIHSIFALSWCWFPSKVTMDRMCPLSDRQPLPGQDSVGDVCCCFGKSSEQPRASIPSVNQPLAGAFPSWVLKGGKKRADRAGTALRWN